MQIEGRVRYGEVWGFAMHIFVSAVIFYVFSKVTMYTLVNKHGNGTGLKMYFLLNMAIFQPAMLVYQRVWLVFGLFFGDIYWIT